MGFVVCDKTKRIRGVGGAIPYKWVIIRTRTGSMAFRCWSGTLDPSSRRYSNLGFGAIDKTLLYEVIEDEYCEAES
jgi:hypothetical protein